MDTNFIKKENKKLNTLLGISITILVLFCFIVIGLAGSIYYTYWNYNDINNSLNDDPNNFILSYYKMMFSSAGIAVLLIFFMISALCIFILNLIGSISILSTKWESEWCKDYKILWGILSLLALSWIGMFVFIFVGKKELKKEKNEQQNLQVVPQQQN